MAASSEDELHPADHAWRRERFAAGALIFGVLGVVASPLLLGLALGPLGMRTGLDLWRARIRRPIVVAGIAASVVATVTSVAAALLWGAVLTQMLLSRDVMRETEKWRGSEIPPSTVAVLDAAGVRERDLTPSPDSERLMVLFIETGTGPCAEALRTLAHVFSGRTAGARKGVELIVVDQFGSAERARAFALEHGLDVGAVGAEAELPPPLDRVFALPTVVVIDRARRVESALAGSRTMDELERLVSGAAALDASSKAR